VLFKQKNLLSQLKTHNLFVKVLIFKISY